MVKGCCLRLKKKCLSHIQTFFFSHRSIDPMFYKEMKRLGGLPFKGMFTLGARVQFSLGTNVNAPFSFCFSARVQGLDLVLGH